MSFEVSRGSLWRVRHRLVLPLAPLASSLFLFILLSGLGTSARAQQTQSSAELGIELYKQGDTPGAIKILEEVVKRHPENVDAWYHLGLAFFGLGYTSAARVPFERVVELRPDSADAHAKFAYVLILGNEPQKATDMARRAIDLGDKSAEAHYAIAEASLRTRAANPATPPLELAINEAETALRIDPNFSLALLTRSFALYHLKRYSEAAESLKSLLALTSGDEDAQTWREQIMFLERQARESQPTTTAPSTANTIFSSREVTQKARVLSKPEPSYTAEARKVGLQGTVVIRAVFSSDGEVKNLYVIQGLPFGLTTNAIAAARRIKFNPAIKDGHAVSTYIQFEYHFNLY